MAPVASCYLASGCHELSLYVNRVCTGQSSDSEHARDQWSISEFFLRVSRLRTLIVLLYNYNPASDVCIVYVR